MDAAGGVSDRRRWNQTMNVHKKRRSIVIASATLMLGACGSRTSLGPGTAPSLDGGGPDNGAVDAQDQTSEQSDVGVDWDAQDGSTVEAGACALIQGSDPGWPIQGSYPDRGLPYDGRARVVNSLVNGLELALTDSMLSSVAPYIYVGGTPAPQLPIGANVWVTLKFEGQPPSAPCAPYDTPGSCPVAIGWAFTVRDVRDGTALFGQTREDPGEHLGFIDAAQALPYCSDTSNCWVTTFYAVNVPGADSNPIPTGGSATLTIADVAYQFWVEAVSTAVPPTCGKEQPEKLVTITFEAKDLASRSAALAP
jgi:hypothetical protein